MKSTPDIILVYPPVMQKFKATDMPFGLMYLAAVLRDIGIRVKILDLNLWRPCEVELTKYFKDNPCSVVGIGGMTTVYYYIKWLATLIKSINPDTQIIAGGSFVTPCPKLILEKTEIDIACIGEAEETITELVSKKPLAKINGIAYKEQDGSIIITSPRNRITQIDKIPFPAYDLVDMQYYIETTGKRPSLIAMAERENIAVDSISNTFIMFASRGCPFSCTFCYRNFGRKVVKHSVDYVLEHLKYARDKFGVNNFAFYDETFNVDRKWVLEFCAQVKKDMPDSYFWMGGARADLLDEQLVKELKDASFYEVSIGVESFDDRILDEMGKGISSDTLFETIDLLKKYKLAPSYLGMLYGFAGDDRISLKRSKKYLERLGISAYFQFPIPFPGTILYEQLRESGKIPDEEEFILKLSDKMTQDLCVNLSRFPDNKLRSMVENTEFSLLLRNEFRTKGFKPMARLYFSKKCPRVCGWLRVFTNLKNSMLYLFHKIAPLVKGLRRL
ncbi:MAG: B12-binding domain-containing radical SAM protein [Candidatus Kariarchaeaceae archaeon]